MEGGVPDTDAGHGAAKTACSPSSTGGATWPTAARRRRQHQHPGRAQRPGETSVAPGQYEAVHGLIHDLEDLKDPVSGERIITEIHLREDVFPGEAMHDASDLLLVLRDFGFVSIKNRLPVGEPRPGPRHTHPDSMFLAYGPGISKGATIAGARSPTSARPCSTAWASRCRPILRARCRRRCSPPSNSSGGR